MNPKLIFELTWWSFTAVLCLLVLSPIYINIGEPYAFYTENALCIIIAVTFLRYIFLLKHHFFTISKWIKIVFMFVPIPVFIFLLDTIYEFQAFVDEEGVYSIMQGLRADFQKGLAAYIKSEMLFFWVAATIATIALPFRMLVSVWREINKGTH